MFSHGSRRTRYAACIALLVVSFSSCGRPHGGLVHLPANPPLSGGLGYALVRDSYVRLKAEPRAEAADLGYLRDGSLVELLGRELASPDVGANPASSRAVLWYRIRALRDFADEGWVRETELELYASREQAERAAAMRQSK